MTITIESPVKTLLNIMRAVGVSAQEATLKITKDGLSFRGKGPSHVDLIDVGYAPSDFKRFEVDQEEKFGVNVNDILKIIKRFGEGKKPDETLEFKVTSDGQVLFTSAKKKFNSRIIDAEEGEGKLPEVAFTSKFTVPRLELLDALEDIALQSERVKIIVKDGKASVTGRGDKGEAEVQLLSAQGVEGGSETVYALDLFKGVVKTIEEDSVLVETGDNKPLKLTMGKIAYFLAPQVIQ